MIENQQRFVSFPIVLAVSCALLGCGGVGGKRIKTAEIKGKVTLNGAPVTRVTMNFTPVQPGPGIQDLCAVDKGVYETKLLGGTYKVWFEPAPGGTEIPAKYRSASTTDLQFEASGQIEKDWDLKH